MNDTVLSVLASTAPPAPVPDGSLTGWLLGGTLLGVLAIARYVKGRRK